MFLALVGGYLLGITSERKLVMELQCNMALRWFVGLNLDQDAWDASTFSQNRRRRFDESGLLEQLFDDTIKRAMTAGLGSRHISGDGTQRSATDPDCRFVSKGTSGSGAYPGYTVNAVRENRHRLLLGLGVEIFQSSTAEKTGCLALLDRAKRRLHFTPRTLGADKGVFPENFLDAA